MDKLTFIANHKLPLRYDKLRQEICQNDGTGIFSIHFPLTYTNDQSKRDEVGKLIYEMLNEALVAPVDIEFIKWYSGMEEEKIRNAYKRYLREVRCTHVSYFVDTDSKAYCFQCGKSKDEIKNEKQNVNQKSDTKNA